MRDISDNVVCAVDDSEAGELAARIASRVAHEARWPVVVVRPR